MQTDTPLPTGHTITLMLKVGNLEIEASGVVRVNYANVAMGIEFTHLNPADQRTLTNLVLQLQAADAPPSLLSSMATLRPVSGQAV